MCGIAGAWHISSEPNGDLVRKAIATLAHRGPDEDGIFVKDNAVLAHSRLSIIDLDNGHQPLHLPERGLHLVANGEIYNYIEIKKDLVDSRFQYQTASDSETILHMYAQFGLAGFERLNGMFACALYDEQQQQLILARDRIGIKPLFYAKVAEKIVFGSEIKAVLAQLSSMPNIDEQSLLEFLQNQFYCGENTIFDGIKQVLPGEVLTISKSGGISKHRYWDATNVTPSDFDLSSAKEHFESLFQQVMTEHLRSDVPLGLFLSGGIDSSILLAELTAMQDTPLRTFSVGYEGVSMQDELSQAEALAQQFKTEHTSLKVNREQMFNRIPTSIWAADDLMRDYACLPLLMLSEEASKDLKVVFSGEGGDEAFAGYRRYRSGLEQTLKAWFLGAGGLRSTGQLNQQAMKTILPSSMQKRDFRASVKQAWQNSPSSWSLMQRRQYVDITTALESNLLVKADRMLMAYGLEGRVPFCDHRIIEFGLSLSDKVKYPGKKGKWLLRQWASEKLPADHLNQPKRGFYVPVKEWFSGDFLVQLGQKLSANKAIQHYFNAEAIAPLIKAQQQGKNYSRELYSLMQFAIWHRLCESPGGRPETESNPLDWL